MDGNLEKKTAISVKEVAVYLGCSEYTVRDMSRKKQLPHYRVGARILFRRSTLDEWIKGQEKENSVAI